MRNQQQEHLDFQGSQEPPDRKDSQERWERLDRKDLRGSQDPPGHPDLQERVGHQGSQEPAVQPDLQDRVEPPDLLDRLGQQGLDQVGQQWLILWTRVLSREPRQSASP